MEEPKHIGKSIKEDKNISHTIKQLLDSQYFAALSTHTDDESHTCLITYTTSPDYKNIIFATPIATRKFEHISKCKNVSLLIDNRSEYNENINKIAALTVLGTVQVAQTASEIENYRDIILHRHPYMKKFIFAPSTALVKISDIEYIYVTNFQEVYEWTP